MLSRCARMGICLSILWLVFANLFAHSVNGSNVVNLNDRSTYPKLVLPWGIWQASSYDKEGEFYVFENVRFGKAPVGNLRFAPAEFPDHVDQPELQDNDAGNSCIQVNPSDLKDLQCSRYGLAPGDVPYKDISPTEQNEDCLFLDLYVPKSGIESGQATLPVVVWFYGGAYIFGSKEVAASDGYLYNPAGLLRTAKSTGKQMIFVGGNYRLGAFGWLAGSYMEENGFPNAGLSDQHLILQFVQKYIKLVGGDNTKVSAWGESAGGGSILHHLIAEGGKQDPLFQKAIVQSPAYMWAYDRPGTLNKTYQSFANAAGCGTHEISCLRKLESAHLIKANLAVIAASTCSKIIPFGPAIDGKVVQGLTLSEFAKGNYWKNVETIIGSHVVHEADGFVPKWPVISTQQQFITYLNKIFPGTNIPTNIDNSPLYAPEKFDNNQTLRLIQVASDAYFTSNIRQLYQVYNSPQAPSKHPIYIMKYAWPGDDYAYHASDLIPTFYRDDFDILAFLRKHGFEKLAQWIEPFIPYFFRFTRQFQTYFVSHATTGNPNSKVLDQAIGDPFEWKQATEQGDFLGEVMQVQFTIFPWPPTLFQRINDEVLSKEVLDFWIENAQDLSRAPQFKHKLKSGHSKDEL